MAGANKMILKSEKQNLEEVSKISADYWDDIMINGDWQKRAEIAINSFKEIRKMLIQEYDEGRLTFQKIDGVVMKIEKNIDIIRRGSCKESRKIVNDYLSGKYEFNE
jgi:hypothetical protein